MRTHNLAFILLLAGLLVACGEESSNDDIVDFTPNRGVNDMQGGDDQMPSNGMNQPGNGDDAPAEPTVKFAREILDGAANGPAFAEIADIDGDGRLDLIVSKFGQLNGSTLQPGAITIYLQGNSLNEWTIQEVASPESPIYWPNSIETHDIDGDGDLDLTVGAGFLICEILGRADENGAMLPPAPCGGLFWYEQTAAGWIQHDVVPAGSDLFYHHGLLADVDQDGIDDMVTVGERRYLDSNGLPVDDAQAQWFKGTNTSERFETTPRPIGPGMGSLASLVDVDEDGDLDLLSAEYFANFETKSFAWYEQVETPSSTNPNGTWTRHVIDDTVGPAIQMTLIPDLFGDGQPVAVGANHTQTTGDNPQPWESAVYVYSKPEDPTQRWTGRKISQNMVSIPRPNQAAPGIFGHGDVDGDGDIDLLVSGDGDTRVFLLLQNENRTFDTWVFDDNMPQAGAMKVRDLDNDGRPELLVTSFDNNVLYLYRAADNGVHPLRPADIPEWAGTQGGVLQVNYSGDAEGPLVVALFTEWPPAGPPVGFKLEENPSYPFTAEFPAVEPGEYVAIAFIDVDGSGPMGPTEPDVQTTLDVVFPTNGPVMVNLSGGAGDIPEPNPGNVLEITYGGTEDGPLVVAMFNSWPPMGPPAAFEQIAAPNFPETVEFPALQAGDYTAMVFIDVDGSGPMSATAEDVQARVEVTFPADFPIAIDLGGADLPGNLETIRAQVVRQGRTTPLVAYVPDGNDELPLVLFTPGFQIESAAYANLCQALAAEGYIVARMDPPGTIFDVNHIEMAADIRAAIDWILNDSDFADRVDTDLIGTMGHSLGGKVALMNAIEDPRVQAVFAIDPVDGDPSPFPDLSTRPDLAPGPIGNIQVPIGLIGETTNGTSDNVFAPACAPAEENFQTIFDAATGSDWVVEWNILGADHMDFVEVCAEGPFSPCSLCPDGSLTKERVQAITLDLVLAFFELHFGAGQGMEARLFGDQLPGEVEMRRR